ncbi:MAG: hypothetical protein ACM3VV_00090 [Deltaproteobacteria bacterium]
MNNLVTVVGIFIVTLLIVSPFILTIEKAYAKDAFWTGYDDGLS